MYDWLKSRSLGMRLLIVVLASLVIAPVLGLFFGVVADPSDDTSARTTATAVTSAAPPPNPTRCLEQAGLTDVQQRTPELWRGTHLSPFFAVLVESFPTLHDAEEAVRFAPNVWVARADTFVVTGPLPHHEEGAIVYEVASCLRS